MSDREFNSEIINLMGEELVMKVYHFAKSRPVSFSAVAREIITRKAEALWGLGRSKQFIARVIGKSVRTVERYINASGSAGK